MLLHKKTSNLASNYLAFRESAIDAGAEVVIEDSITHAWMYKGGVLDLLADAKKRLPVNTEARTPACESFSDKKNLNSVGVTKC